MTPFNEALAHFSFTTLRTLLADLRAADLSDAPFSYVIENGALCDAIETELAERRATA
jgi:hypothetical protein